MRKSLIVLSFSLMTCVGAAALMATASAQAPTPAGRDPVLLAQNTPPAPNAQGRGRGPARTTNRPAPTTAERTQRRNEMCQGIVARTAGRFAELEVRLNLTSAQTGAFNRWRDARLAAAKTQAGECTSRPLPPAPPQGGGRGTDMTPPNPVERLTREETMLQHRLTAIQSERPALEALYTSLSPAQRQTFARERGFGRGGFGMGGPRGGMGGMGPRGGNMMFRRGGPGMGMQGPGPGMMGRGRGPMGGPMGGPGNQPPPPPAQ